MQVVIAGFSRNAMGQICEMVSSGYKRILGEVKMASTCNAKQSKVVI